MDGTPGLREQKKAATRTALHEAAVRLTGQHGLDHVTVEAIADAAHVSRRTFSNYFSGKEEALFHGDAEWLRSLLTAARRQPQDVDPWTALIRATEQVFLDTETPDRAWLAQRRRFLSHPGLLVHGVATYARLEGEVTAEVLRRISGTDGELRARVMAAAFLATVRVAVQHWIEHPEEDLARTATTALRLATPSPVVGERARA